jgi:hypothetical protein
MMVGAGSAPGFSVITNKIIPRIKDQIKKSVHESGKNKLRCRIRCSFYLAMRTAGPATRPAFSVCQVLTHSLDTMASCFCFLGGGRPANPLIARERRDIFPCGPHLGRRNNGFPEIHRRFVHNAIGKIFSSHADAFFGFVLADGRGA